LLIDHYREASALEKTCNSQSTETRADNRDPNSAIHSHLDGYSRIAAKRPVIAHSQLRDLVAGHQPCGRHLQAGKENPQTRCVTD
jgi:hypothetical protein